MHTVRRPSPTCSGIASRPLLAWIPLVAWLAVACGPASVAPIAEPAAPGSSDAAAVYAANCAACHGPTRYGGYAPPLIPQTLAKRSDASLRTTIREGLPATQMPAFGATIDEPTAAALVGLLREPVGAIHWTAEDVAASRVELASGAARLGADVSRENLIFVVERGRASVSIVDGDSLEELDRFEVGRIHGGLKFDLGLRSAFAATRDGSLIAYDLVRGVPRAKAKVAVNTRNVAVSADGAFVAVANQLPENLAILDGELRPRKILTLPGRPSAVYAQPGEAAFLLALRDVSELWRVRLPELEAEAIPVPEPFEDLVMVPGTRRLVASARGGRRLILYDLGRREVVATLATAGLPHLFSACFFERDGTPFAAFNHMGAPKLSIVDMRTFTLEREIPLAGSGYFARTHPASPYLWVDTNTEHVQLVDKRSLELLPREVTPAPGKKAMHVEFTADGDKALLSVWADDGAVVVYDARSLEEVARLPYALPVGKYNAWNKTRHLRP